MKKYITLAILATSLIFTSCDPMKDIYKDIDSKESSVKKTTSYELTAADYTTIAGLLDKNNPHAAAFKAMQAFDQNVTAQGMIPHILKVKYPEWGKASSVNVTYKEVLPIDKKIQTLGTKTYVILGEKALNTLGINSLKNLSDDQVKIIINAAKVKEESANSILIRATLSETESRLFFAFNGELTGKDYYTISWEEFDQMGLGRYANFSSSNKPEDYIPALLAQKYPYAKEGDSHIMIYAFYVSKKVTEVRAVKYEKKNKVWIPASSVQVKTSQFIHTGKAWVFDPTIDFELTSEDFAYLHAWVKEKHPNYISEANRSNEEFWFGSSGKHRNFNIGGGKTVGERPEEDGKTPEELQKIRFARLAEALNLLLAHRYPSQPAQVNGLDQMYRVKVATYNKGDRATWLYTFKGLGSGKFQLEGKPEQM